MFTWLSIDLMWAVFPFPNWNDRLVYVGCIRSLPYSEATVLTTFVDWPNLHLGGAHHPIFAYSPGPIEEPGPLFRSYFTSILSHCWHLP